MHDCSKPKSAAVEKEIVYAQNMLKMSNNHAVFFAQIKIINNILMENNRQ